MSGGVGVCENEGFGVDELLFPLIEDRISLHLMRIKRKSRREEKGEKKGETKGDVSMNLNHPQ